MRACVRACVRANERASERACVRACVCVCGERERKRERTVTRKTSVRFSGYLELGVSAKPAIPLTDCEGSVKKKNLL